MVDLWTRAHDPSSALYTDDATLAQLTEDLRRGIAELRRELAYRRLWVEYQEVRRELDAVKQEG